MTPRAALRSQLDLSDVTALINLAKIGNVDAHRWSQVWDGTEVPPQFVSPTLLQQSSGATAPIHGLFRNG